jgi:hypothetical protein
MRFAVTVSVHRRNGKKMTSLDEILGNVTRTIQRYRAAMILVETRKREQHAAGLALNDAQLACDQAKSAYSEAIYELEKEHGIKA